MPSMLDKLRDLGLSDGVLFDGAIEVILRLSEIASFAAPAGSDDKQGTVTFGFSAQPLFLDLALRPPGPAVPFLLRANEAGAQFRLWYDLAQTPPAKTVFDLVATSPDKVLRPARRETSGGGAGERLVADPSGSPVTITGTTVALLIEGIRGSVATMRLVPAIGAPDGLVTLRLEPSTVLIGSSGFGFELPNGLVFDASDTSGPPPSVAAGASQPMPGDDPAWHGLAARNMRFYLPADVPLIGGHAVDAALDIGLPPRAGIAMSIHTKIPATAGQAGIEVTIECIDPVATGLNSFVPTLVEATMTLPVSQHPQDVAGQSVTFMGGDPLLARVRYARDATSTDNTMHMQVSIEGQGADGVLSVDARSGGAAKLVTTAAALATAIIADSKADKTSMPGGDGSGVVLHTLLVGALGLSAFFQDKGKFVVNTVTLASEGRGLPVGGTVRFVLDYSVDVLVVPIKLAALQVAMSDAQPMRVRVRNVVLAVNPAETGLKMFQLDFDHANMEIEDPGSWIVHSPGSLFDVLGTRSGRGSAWIEVDLGFKLNLGPIKVNGATIRATLEGARPVASLRGLDAGIDIPAAFEAHGALQIADPGGVAALLAANIVPLKIAAEATLNIDLPMIVMSLAVDLPGPLPIGSSGLGLYGVKGAFGIAARPAPPPPNVDPVQYQLAWDSSSPAAFVKSAGDFTFGLEAVIGTALDLGFTFSAKAGLFLTLPDLAIRGAIDAHFFSPRPKVTERPAPDDPGISLRGVVVVDPADATTFGLNGKINGAPLFVVTIPIGGRFPVQDAGTWYINIGTDGYAGVPDRKSGPARIRILPDLLNQGADGYLMLRGDGLINWPRGKVGGNYDGFVLAFGFGVELTMGFRPLAWASVHARLDVIVATRPLVIAGFGSIGGSLNLGPISIGVDAEIEAVMVSGQPPYLYGRVCGRVRLLFVTIKGCAKISFGGPMPNIDIPAPDVHPLDRLEGADVVGDQAHLVDDAYRWLADLATEINNAPMVWPDALPHLVFSTPPELGPALTGGQFPDVETYPEGTRAMLLGSDFLRYRWQLRNIRLIDITGVGDPSTEGTPVEGVRPGQWQRGKFGDPGSRTEPAELVLLTPERELFVEKLPDAGKSLAHNPLKQRANICQAKATAEIGWAIGGGADALDTGWRLPPDPTSDDPLLSVFSVLVSPTRLGAFDGLPVEPFGIWTLPPWFESASARMEVYDPPLDFKHVFGGALTLTTVLCHPSMVSDSKPVPLVARVAPSAAIRDGIVVLLSDTDPARSRQRRVTVIDGNGAWSDPQVFPMDDKFLLLFEAPSGNWSKWIEIGWPSGITLSLAGVGGLTQFALRTAETRNVATKKEAQKLADAAAKGPPVNNSTPDPSRRNLLKPGRHYRLDVGMAWSGEMFRQDDNGDRKRVNAVADQTAYGPGGRSTNRSYYFQTTPAPQPSAPAAAPGTIEYGAVGYLTQRFRGQSLFKPELLSRHLLGYDPAQSETDRFRNDALSAHFGVTHVAALADAYGFDLKIGSRRVDAPGPDGEQKLLDVALTYLTTPSFLKGPSLDRFAMAAAAPCAQPGPGLSLIAKAELAPRCWYEAFVDAAPQQGGVHGRLPGVSFRTSRWQTARDMMKGLRFPVNGAGVADGDIEVTARPSGPPVVLGDDGAFDAAMIDIGLAGWPAAAEPRASLLWTHTATDGWLFAGILLESPEPIHRPGRLAFDSVALEIAPSQASRLDFRRLDRSGSRLLCLTSKPFAPTPWHVPSLRLPIASPAQPSAANRSALARKLLSASSRAGFNPVTRLNPGFLQIFNQPYVLLKLLDRPGSSQTALTGRLHLTSAPSFAQEAE